MNINWKLRLQNKATLAAIIACGVSLVYQVLGVFGVVPGMTESEIMNIIAMILNILTMMGVVIDPTTSGVNDSARAMNYTKPN